MPIPRPQLFFPRRHTGAPAYTKIFEAAANGHRVSDDAMKYLPDTPGEEHKGDASVWRMFLDEAESRDQDMLAGYREIIDGVIVSASLFSGAIGSFIWTNRLGPSDSDVIVSLLIETNQLLRSAGNITSIINIPPADLSESYYGAGPTVYETAVTGLFSTSLVLSLITALFAVLVKQWLHSYSLFIKGDAKTRALITDFRSEGLRTWRMRQIVEALPLMLHCSILIFFVAFVACQESLMLFFILMALTASAFIIYFTSAFLPVLFISCPYRIPYLFKVGQSIMKFLLPLILLARDLIRRWLWTNSDDKMPFWTKKTYKRTLQEEEASVIFNKPERGLDALERFLGTTAQRAKRQMIIDAVFSSLLELERSEEDRSELSQPLKQTFERPLVSETFRLSLTEYVEIDGSTDDEDRIETIGIWENRILFLHERMESDDEKLSVLLDAYGVADQRGNENACKSILDWIGTSTLQGAANASTLHNVMKLCTANGIRQILERTTAVLSRVSHSSGETILHYWSRSGNLDAAKAAIEADHSEAVVNSISQYGETPLDIVLLSADHEFVNYLMDNGARANYRNYERAFFDGIKCSKWDIVKLLWNRRREVGAIDTRVDSWCIKSATDVGNIGPFGESTRRELVEVLQECDDHHHD